MSPSSFVCLCQFWLFCTRTRQMHLVNMWHKQESGSRSVLFGEKDKRDWPIYIFRNVKNSGKLNWSCDRSQWQIVASVESVYFWKMSLGNAHFSRFICNSVKFPRKLLCQPVSAESVITHRWRHAQREKHSIAFVHSLSLSSIIKKWCVFVFTYRAA